MSLVYHSGKYIYLPFYILGYILIKILCQQDYFQITEKTFIKEVINPFTLICRNSFIVIMNDDLVPHAFQYLHYNKIFKESFPPGIRGNINQFGMNISYNVVNMLQKQYISQQFLKLVRPISDKLPAVAKFIQ